MTRLARACAPLLMLAATLGCAGSVPGSRAPAPIAPAALRPSPSPERAAPAGGVSARAAAIAAGHVGVPYRYGGRGPAGFDCSGLVVYSYARAGLPGLPHSAAALEHRVRPVALRELAPGDLLFFDLDGKKAAHVAIYVGDGAFVHAPSAGRAVETVGFDHVYWGPRIRRAGRLAP